MINPESFPRYNSRRAGADEDMGNEAIIDEINKEDKSVGVTVHNTRETYRVREERMGTCPTQEVPTNLLIGPMKVRVCGAHRFWAHHLL